MLNRINWPQIINDLIKVGETETSIAKAVDSSQPAIHRYKTGFSDDPAHMLGERLIDLHARLVVGKSATDSVVAAGDALGYDAINHVAKAA